MRRFLLTIVVCLLAFTPAKGQPFLQRTTGPGLVKSGADCSGGLRYDDGSFESGYKFNSFAVTTGSYAMAFDVPAGSSITAVCTCWSLGLGDSGSSIGYNIKVWAADGPGGAPGTVLGQTPGSAFNVSFLGGFARTEMNVPVSGTRVWIGPEWHPGAAPFIYICSDENGPTLQPGYRGETSAPPDENMVTVFPSYHALGLRAEYEAAPPPPPDPDPPTGPWLTTAELPGYQFKVRINGGSLGSQVADCVPETLCVAGAIPTRAELFLRVIGPRPNGYLWVEAIRFTISHLELWVDNLGTSETKYYNLASVPTDATVIPGLVDTQAFRP
jgi:hypothetical protein